jgi:hypothetical protein
MTNVVVALVLLCCCVSSTAAITIDGVRDVEYILLAAQTVKLETNQNALTIFIDGADGAGMSLGHPPVKFAAGFTVRWEITIRTSTLTSSVGYFERLFGGGNRTGTAAAAYDVASNLSSLVSSPLGVSFVINNNNIAGIGADAGAITMAADLAAARAVTTSIEIALDLSLFNAASLRSATALSINVVLQNQDQSQFSNQVLPGYAVGTTVSAVQGTDFGAFQSGNQYISINYASVSATTMTILPTLTTTVMTTTQLTTTDCR